MKWINKNIVIISFIWWLMQGVFLLLNEIRVYYENKEHLIDSLFIISIGLIIISCLLLVRKSKIVLLLGILLLLYSIFTMFFMTILFFMEAHGNILLNICLCFVTPIINVLISVTLLKNNIMNKRSHL